VAGRSFEACSVTASTLALSLAVFLATAVEVVEALTIVLAVGVTRDWRSMVGGVASALVVLTGLVAVLGPALANLPIDVLRVVVGGLLLVFGLQWLRKAILRAAGYKPLHNEMSIYERAVTESRGASSAPGQQMDWYAFTVSFKSVLLEGLEVVFIVITFGAVAGSLAPAALGAGLAIAIVVAAGIALRAPLTRVPENTLKFVVGAMLTTFGLFWSIEGLGIEWPLSDAAIPLILLYILAVGVVLILAFARVLEQNGLATASWLIGPLGIFLILALSIARATSTTSEADS
jgi:uncharacterized membrane protein